MSIGYNAPKAVLRPCEEKGRLRELYVTALHELVGATTVLQRAQLGPEFLDALAKTQQARSKHDDARRSYEAHRKAHGCMEPSPDDPPPGNPDAPVRAPLKPTPHLRRLQ